MQDKIKECEAKREDAAEPVCGKDAEGDVVVNYDMTLLPLIEKDMPLVRSWRNDYRIWKWCRQNDLISECAQERWFKKQNEDPSIRMYMIRLLAQNTAVDAGVCGLTSIDMINRRAEFSLYIAPSFHGKGLGDNALRLLLRHGFNNFGLHIVYGEVFDGNPALKNFEALGFRREGTRRDFYFRAGKFIDAHLISIKASEWKE